MKPNFLAGLLIVWVLQSVALGQTTQTPQERVIDRIVAIVGNEAITLSEAERRLEAGKNPVLEALSGGVGDKGLETAIEELIAEKLLLAEAKRLDLRVDDKEVQQFIDGVAQQNGWSREELEAQLRAVGFANIQAYEAFVRKDLLRSQVLRMKVGSKVRVSDREVEEEFNRQTEGGKTEDEVHLAHIVLRIPEHVTEEEIRSLIEKAKQVRELAVSGDFGEVARRYGEDASAEKGGDIGWIRRGKFQSSIEDVAFSLKDGEVSQVVLSSVGFHILKSLGHRRVPLKDPEEVKARIRYELSEASFRKLYREYLQELRKTANVEVRWP